MTLSTFQFAGRELPLHDVICLVLVRLMIRISIFAC